MSNFKIKSLSKKQNIKAVIDATISRHGQWQEYYNNGKRENDFWLTKKGYNEMIKFLTELFGD